MFDPSCEFYFTIVWKLFTQSVYDVIHKKSFEFEIFDKLLFIIEGAITKKGGGSQIYMKMAIV